MSIALYINQFNCGFHKHTTQLILVKYFLTFKIEVKKFKPRLQFISLLKKNKSPHGKKKRKKEKNYSNIPIQIEKITWVGSLILWRLFGINKCKIKNKRIDYKNNKIESLLWINGKF